MNFSFHPDAALELNQAVDYYKNINPDLGLKFSNEIYLAIQRAISLPKAWTIIDNDIRRLLVNNFPYGILYSELKNEIFIIAVMHLHKQPNYWKNR